MTTLIARADLRTAIRGSRMPAAAAASAGSCARCGRELTVDDAIVYTLHGRGRLDVNCARRLGLLPRVHSAEAIAMWIVFVAAMVMVAALLVAVGLGM